MATLYITELEEQGRDGNNQLAPAPQLPPVAQQTVAVGAGSIQSAALNARTRMVRLVSDVACSIDVGANPTATATSLRLSANVPEYFAVKAGLKIAAIANS